MRLSNNKHIARSYKCGFFIRIEEYYKAIKIQSIFEVLLHCIFATNKIKIIIEASHVTCKPFFKCSKIHFNCQHQRYMVQKYRMLLKHHGTNMSNHREVLQQAVKKNVKLILTSCRLHCSHPIDIHNWDIIWDEGKLW